MTVQPTTRKKNKIFHKAVRHEEILLVKVERIV